MYETIYKTAEGFCQSFKLDPQTGRLDADLILSYRSPGCRQVWGHTYSASRTPGLDQEIDNETFMSHIQSFFGSLQNVAWDVKGIYVDEQRRAATVRICCAMSPKGVQEVIDNDMLFVLEMDEEGKKIDRLIEYADPAAVGRLFELINPIVNHA